MNPSYIPFRTTMLDGFTIPDIQELVDENPYLRGYLQGYLAEAMFRRQAKEVPGVDSVEKIPDNSPKKGDFLVSYRGQDFSIECKSFKTGSMKEDASSDSWSARVACKSSDKAVHHSHKEGLESTHLHKGGFDILAVSCFPITQKWDFVFVENFLLPESKEAPGLIKTSFTLDSRDTPGLTTTLVEALEKCYSRRTQNPAR